MDIGFHFLLLNSPNYWLNVSLLDSGHKILVTFNVEAHQTSSILRKILFLSS